MLYLVATPIGNLGDISHRALETLRAVDYVASEDTRKTGVLLRHFDIKKPQISFHEHNERQSGERIVALLKQGRSVAVVTDAGTPGIADPGFTIVRRALQEGIELTMIPGPAALVMALVLSGLAVHSFTFRGFPPRKPGPRRRFLALDAHSPHTLIFYESPYRIQALLTDALAVYGDRRAALANDLTKLFEHVERGPLSHLLEHVQQGKLRGEYVLLVAGAEAEESWEPGPANAQMMD
jgi:16S rRNA (cytidine1402-2'-O)-methyltransferase